MTEKETKKENKPKESTSQAKNSGKSSDKDQKSRNRKSSQGGRGRGKKRRNTRRGKQRSEFDNKIISIRRVTRVVAGGRRFNFSVAMVVGDKKGKVGVGTGKAGDMVQAIEKASRNAKKNMVTISLTGENTIAHDVQAKYCASQVVIRTAPGRGMTAGGAVRTVLSLAGINDVSAKIISRSKNHLNNAQASIKALKKLTS